MSFGRKKTATSSSSADFEVRLARSADIAEILRVYIGAYGQPPWNEENDPVQSRMYLEWLLGIEGSKCMVVADRPADATGRPQVRGMVMAAPRTADEFYEDWNRICHPLARGWPVLPTVANSIGYIYEFAVDPSWQGQGLGNRVIDSELAALIQLGAELIALRTSERAPVAVRLYEKRGFVRWPLRERQQSDARWWYKRTLI